MAAPVLVSDQVKRAKDADNKKSDTVINQDEWVGGMANPVRCEGVEGCQLSGCGALLRRATVGKRNTTAKLASHAVVVLTFLAARRSLLAASFSCLLLYL